MSGPVDAVAGSILFTDLVGFTAFTEAVGDHRALAVLEHQRRLVDTALAGRRGARVVKELGDGVMAWFPHAVDGLACAVALLRAIESCRREGTFPLAVRMGLHHGAAVTRGDDLVGRAVNVAARVADLAGPGELLVSAEALEACLGTGQPIPSEPVGPVRVKGVTAPVWLHRVTNVT